MKGVHREFSVEFSVNALTLLDLELNRPDAELAEFSVSSASREFSVEFSVILRTFSPSLEGSGRL